MTDTWLETTMDVDPGVKPDIIGSMTNLSAIPAASFDAVYSSHSIEHLYAHEVPVALASFRRILKPDGFALITCPDLQSICALIAEGNLTGTAYMSPAGPISALDVVYGYRAAIAAGQVYMAHRTGFTLDTLRGELVGIGFGAVAGMRRAAPYFDLWVLAFMSSRIEPAQAQETAASFFPR